MLRSDEETALCRELAEDRVEPRGWDAAAREARLARDGPAASVAPACPPSWCTAVGQSCVSRWTLDARSLTSDVSTRAPACSVIGHARTRRRSARSARLGGRPARPSAAGRCAPTHPRTARSRLAPVRVRRRRRRLRYRPRSPTELTEHWFAAPAMSRRRRVGRSPRSTGSWQRCRDREVAARRARGIPSRGLRALPDHVVARTGVRRQGARRSGPTRTSRPCCSVSSPTSS